MKCAAVLLRTFSDWLNRKWWKCGSSFTGCNRRRVQWDSAHFLGTGQKTKCRNPSNFDCTMQTHQSSHLDAQFPPLSGLKLKVVVANCWEVNQTNEEPVCVRTSAQSSKEQQQFRVKRSYFGGGGKKVSMVEDKSSETSQH